MKPVLDAKVLTKVHFFTTSRALCHNEENQEKYCTPKRKPLWFGPKSDVSRKSPINF